jgi:hypothetical protein
VNKLDKKTINKITKIVESANWSINIQNNEFLFSKYSPAGQDFNIEITANDIKDLIDKIFERYDNFDCSEETYLWLDSSGHGANGAPYNMKDLYEDMEACQEMILELYEALRSKFNYKG